MFGTRLRSVLCGQPPSAIDDGAATVAARPPITLPRRRLARLLALASMALAGCGGTIARYLARAIDGAGQHTDSAIVTVQQLR